MVCFYYGDKSVDLSRRCQLCANRSSLMTLLNIIYRLKLEKLPLRARTGIMVDRLWSSVMLDCLLSQWSLRFRAVLWFQKVNGTTLFDFTCVFWNYSEGDWSTAGCSKGNSSDELLRCFCNHTTNFAALLVNIQSKILATTKTTMFPVIVYLLPKEPRWNLCQARSTYWWRGDFKPFWR